VIVAGLAAAWGSARYAGCVAVLLLGAMAAVLALPPGERRVLAPEWAVVGLLALAASWAVALDHELALRHSLLLVLAAALFGLSRLAAPDDRLVALLALGIAATAAVACVQALVPPAVSPEAVSGVAPALRERALARLAIGRASGTAALPGHFAALVVMAAPLLVRGWARAAGRRRWVWAAALLLAGAGVVLSRSLAGALLAAVLAAAAVALMRPPRAFAAAAALAVAAVAAAAALGRTDLAALEPVRLRWQNWRTAAAVFAERPLLGVGLGGIGQAALATPLGAANITPYAHNTPLQLVAELGVGGVALLGAGGLALARLLAAGRRAHLALALAVAAVPLHALVDFSAYAPEVLLPWSVLAGTLAARVRPAPARPIPGRAMAAVLGGALVLAALSWRAETLRTRSYAAAPPASIDLALAAARWAPWTVEPVQDAAAAALAAGDPRMDAIERELARRHWVRPVSAAWAELRARLLLATGRAGEALAWAREARRRAPWRGELAALEAACRAHP
jgi:O-antigen ligase